MVKITFFCKKHNIPLIYSSKRTKKCNCGRKEVFTCPNLSCNSCICQQCADVLDFRSINHISNEENTNDDNTLYPDDELEEPTRDISEDNIQDNYDDNPIQHENDTESNNENEEDIFTIQNNNQGDIDVLERDNFDDFVTHNVPPDIDEDDNEFVNNNFDNGDPPDSGELTIPTTDTGEFLFEIEEEIPSDRVHVSGHVILNQNGSVLTRKKCQIKGSSIHKFFLQKICATNIGASIPILYSKSMIFPSIFYHMTNDGAISGIIPSPLMTECINQLGFESLSKHIRSGLTSCSFTTSTDPRYISFAYDTMTNLAVNHEDHRIALNRGLTFDEETDIGLRIRGGKAVNLLY